MGILHRIGLCLTLFTLPVLFAFDYPEKLDYVRHHCKRDCLSPGVTPMVCEYNFTVESYQTFSRACYNCPQTFSDCFRPHCITGDGSTRAIKVVNRLLPGPGIHVCKGDTVVVNVYNQLMDFEGTSIHWHGILQEGTPHMDGVAMLTQCPISVHSVFQYRFQVTSPGTHFWHAHTGMQRADGVHGAFVVRDTDKTSVMSYYDEDLPEHTIVIQDWLDQFTASKYVLHHHAMGDNTPSSILINGRGTAFSQDSDEDPHSGHNMGTMSSTSDMDHEAMTPDDDVDHGNEATTGMQSMDHDGMSDGMQHDGMDEGTMDRMQGDGDHNMESMTQDDDNKVFPPHSVFHVKSGKRYRFRIISNGVVNCPLKVSVEGHNLTVIASDGNDLMPVQVSSLVVYAGERYDVVLNADQLIGNYWMHVVGVGDDCERSRTSQTAIIRYHGAMNMKPTTGDSYEDGFRFRPGLTANPVKFTIDTVTVAQMTSYTVANDVFSGHDVKKFYILLGYNKVSNYRYLDPDHYPLHVMYDMHKGMHANHLYALQINQITYMSPDIPVLSQYNDVDERMFCNETSSPRDCSKEFCECVHRIKVGLDDVVELVLIGDGKHGMGNHPMHLHGHSFYIMGMEKLNTTIERSEIERMDRQGRLRRNFIDPVKKDTVVVPDGGYTIIRFKANNPGFWLFHCHVDFHLHLGLSMIIQVGETHEMVPTPVNFPRCGSWKFSPLSSGPYNACAQAIQNNASALYKTFSVLIICLVLSLLTK